MQGDNDMTHEAAVPQYDPAAHLHAETPAAPYNSISGVSEPILNSIVKPETDSKKPVTDMLMRAQQLLSNAGNDEVMRSSILRAFESSAKEYIEGKNSST